MEKINTFQLQRIYESCLLSPICSTAIVPFKSIWMV